MRDKNRIPKILEELEKVWKANPDFRLGQLLMAAVQPKDPCPDMFYIEDEELLEKLISFENRTQKANHDWKKYPNISKIDSKEISIELLLEFIHIIKVSNKKIVITPINLMSLNGAPVRDQNWLLSQKSRLKKLKKLLIELKEKEILSERKSKHDFLGIKEVGYDIIE